MPNLRLQDIAAEAGVSKAAVSMALRNHPGVSRQLCRRIQQLAQELGYQPNPLVNIHMAHVRTGHTAAPGQRIAYLESLGQQLGKSSHDSINQTRLFKGAKNRAQTLGYAIELFSLSPGTADLDHISRVIRARGIDGVVIGPVPSAWPELALRWEWFAVATMGYSLERPRIHRACTNQFELVRLALSTTVKRGCQRIGMIVNRDLNKRVGDRLLGSYLSYDPGEMPIRLIPPLLWDPSMTQTALSAWLKQYNPDGLLVSGEALANMLIKAKHPPRPFILNFLSHAISKDADLPLRPTEAVGAACVELVVEQLRNNQRGIPNPRKTVLLEATLNAMIPS